MSAPDLHQRAVDAFVAWCKDATESNAQSFMIRCADDLIDAVAALRVELQAARELGESWRNLAIEADDRTQHTEAALHAAQEALRELLDVVATLAYGAVGGKHGVTVDRGAYTGTNEAARRARAVLVEGAPSEADLDAKKADDEIERARLR